MHEFSDCILKGEKYPVYDSALYIIAAENKIRNIFEIDEALNFNENMSTNIVIDVVFENDISFFAEIAI